jgi:carboxypeptidase Q
MAFRILLQLALIAPFFFTFWGSTNAQPSVDIDSYQDEALEIIDTALNDEESFQKLTYFVDKFGHRFSGSESLEKSIDWIVSEMENQPFDNVTTQEVMVPHWVRGEESATLLSPREKDLPMLGLGGSIATPEDGIEAEVLVVESFNNLKEKADQAEGKIIVYNVPFKSYGETV